MTDSLIPLLNAYRMSMVEIFGSSLSEVILYGSYARGDNKQGSDIDIMILADVKPEEISRYADKVYDITYDFEMLYNKEINPNVQSISIFNKWKETYPFYKNIEKDGIIV